MGHRSRFRYVSCTRKVAHPSREAAYAVLEATLGDRIERMRPYECDFCKQWHNGHPFDDRLPLIAPLADEEPYCGCGHGADSHEDWWCPNGHCAFCQCPRSRQHIYRTELRVLRRKQRTLSALMTATCRFYFPAMRRMLSEYLSAIAKSLRG